MSETIATRAAYGETMAALAKDYPDVVVLDADLSGSTMSKKFADVCPERFFNIGIAEANMAGIAAGLATCGKKPFIHAIMRAIPGMLVVSPCDGPAMRLATKALLDYEGPAYMRLGRLAVESVTDEIPGYTFQLGKGFQLRDGSDVTVIATGMMVQEAVKASNALNAQGVSVRVIDMATIKPLDEEIVLKAARETGAIVTSEEATVLGGLGSAVCECVAAGCPVPVVRHGVQDEFGRSGAAKQVLAAYGLTADGIIESVKKVLALKK